MSNATETAINAIDQITSLDDLREVCRAFESRRKIIIQRSTQGIRRGDMVRIKTPEGIKVGTITKVNRVNFHADIENKSFNVAKALILGPA